MHRVARLVGMKGAAVSDELVQAERRRAVAPPVPVRGRRRDAVSKQEVR